MKIDMDRNYWNEYYAKRKIIESGKGTSEDYEEARKLYALAEAQGKITSHNMLISESY